MTAAFEVFMQQYRMTGSEKADGYSRDAFLGLDDEEKETVFGLLLNELPFSAEWLFFLDREKAIAVAKVEETRLRRDAYAHAYMIQEQLLRHTGELVYQRHMLEDYPHYAAYLKPHLISAVGRTPQNSDTSAFLRQVILTDADEHAVARAAWVLSSGLPVRDKETRDRLIDGVRSMAGKTIALAQFDGTAQLLEIQFATGERQLVAAQQVAPEKIAFGLYDTETVALVATPGGPLLVLDQAFYRPAIGATVAELLDEGDSSRFRLLHAGKLVFELVYEAKFGTGLHPYNRSREDIDFYFWLKGKVTDPAFYQAYTREIICLEQRAALARH
ncbi:hypothetical protein [Pseudoduganella sp.]|uniref:hypothetical protein n=1 Tax=Pseudoduganella sp. TaxID=1880898 RepID=UPI0035B372CF